MLKAPLIAFGIVALFACFGLRAQASNQPADQKSGSPQQQAAPEQRAANQAAPVVIVQKAAETAHKPEADNDHGPNNRSNAWTLSDKIAAIAIVVGFLQFVALVATVQVMTATARRQLRAYVLVKGARLENWDSVDDPAIATVVVRNYGQTPAYSVDSFVGIAPHNYPLTIEVKAPENLKTVKSILAPGGEHIFRVPTRRALEADEIVLVSSGEAAIYVVGRISYVDAFKKNRVTNFLLFYGGEIGAAPDGLMGPYETGNDAT
jgi:hypothetical protein